MTDRRDHWNALYESKEEAALTWFEEAAALSLELIVPRAKPGDPILDVGGGAARLVDGLAAAGLGPVTVLDLSAAAIAMSRRRLGGRADGVHWIEADVTHWTPPQDFKIWHDRAVFHFLTDPADRSAYLRTMGAALVPGGHAILATFDLDGPERCAGLPVRRYSPETLTVLLEQQVPGKFALEEARRHTHRTPIGNKQEFQVSVYRRVSSSGVGDR